jgi:hypothetical protein
VGTPDLIHLSATPLAAVHSVTQAVEPAWKPNGLWVSDESGEDGWIAWCRAERFHLEALAYQTRIHLVRGAPLIRLATARELRRFTETYGARPAWHESWPWSPEGSAIAWAAVARDALGILISPYQWACRLEPRTCWYAGWDCACGCIWEANAIDRVEPLARKEAR